MGLTASTPPTTEPVTLVEAKLHLRVTHDAEDALISRLIHAARSYCEDVTGRAFIDTTYAYTLDAFSNVMLLPRSPVDSVTSITYLDTAEASQTLATSEYDVFTDTEPGRVELSVAGSWPGTSTRAAAVTINFVAGYGTTVFEVPDGLRAAILLLVGNLYEHREATVAGSVITDVPFGVEALLWQHRILEVA